MKARVAVGMTCEREGTERGDVVNLIFYASLTPSIALSSVSIGGAAAFL